MTLKIDRSTKGAIVTYTLSGQINREQFAELRRLLESERPDQRIVLDLKEVTLVDGDAVKFLARCEANGAELVNSPAYIREWIMKERG
jgi:anti-anti-sigma regulatory factor